MPARALANCICFLNQPLVHYRINTKNQLTRSGNISSQLKKSYNKAWKVLKKYKLHKALKKSFNQRKEVAKIWAKKNKAPLFPKG